MVSRNDSAPDVRFGMASSQPLSMGRRWLSFAIVLALSTLGSMVMFKASPVFPLLISDMGFDGSTIGLMMSMYSIIGAVLAFPVGGILGKIGFRRCLYVIAGSLIVGGALGALSPNVPVLLASRFIEGIANGFIAVMCSASVALLLPPEKHGLGMGLAGAWFPLGALISLNIAPAIAGAVGWRGLWWVMVVIAVILLICAAVAFRMPERSAGDPSQGAAARPSAKPLWASVVLTAVVMGCFGLVFGGAEGSFYPTFLQTEHHMDAQLAGTAASIINLMNVVFGPVAGIISDKIHSPKKVMVIGAVLMLALYLCAFSSNIVLVWVFIALMGVSCAFVSTGIYSTVPIVVRSPEKIGIGMACVAFLQNIGITVGSSVFGILQTSMGWYPASLALLVPVAVVALVASLLVKLPVRSEGATS